MSENRIRYQDEIDLFFTGQDDRIVRHSPEKGHVWICGHKVFDTLTVEPPEGGQMEIAVRFNGPRVDYRGGRVRDKHSGYIAGPGYFFTRNTGGH